MRDQLKHPYFCRLIKKNTVGLGDNFLFDFVAAVVAVSPSQEKPLKIAMVVQSEPADYWLIKVSQISCTETKPFKGRKQRIQSRKERIVFVV